MHPAYMVEAALSPHWPEPLENLRAIIEGLLRLQALNGAIAGFGRSIMAGQMHVQGSPVRARGLIILSLGFAAWLALVGVAVLAGASIEAMLSFLAALS